MTQLADFSCRSGDLISDGIAGPTAQEGIKAHKYVQKRRNEASTSSDHLLSEFVVSNELDVEELQILLSGRIDLVDEKMLVLSEIKTTLVPSLHIPESKRALQWAQLYLYGYLYWQQSETRLEGCNELSLELIHFNIRDRVESPEVRVVSLHELEQFALQALVRYVRWIKKIRELECRLNTSANSLEFPYQRFREGQRDMAAAIFRASRDSTQLMCEAPTGLGKTVSSLYPAFKAVANSDVLQIVYLTAKVAGRLSAREAMFTLIEKGLDATVIQMRAKDSCCFCSTGGCERDDDGRCPMTLGFFDRLPDARDELLSLGLIDPESLDAIAWEHQLCPYELARQLLPWVHVVIADFNYVFDPLVRMPHFSNYGKHSVLLIDEAHNLLDRSRHMYSASLSRERCALAANECKSVYPSLASKISTLSRKLLTAVKNTEEGLNVSIDQPQAIAKSVSSVLEHFSAVISSPESSAFGDSTSQLWSELCRYAVVSDLYSEQHRCIVNYPQASQKTNRKKIEISLVCLDASKALAVTYGKFRTSVAFSATLRPAAFYRDSLGFDEDVAFLQLASPFDAANCAHHMVDWIDTRYQQRDSSVADLIMLIKQCTDQKIGNYVVFLPSYAYLEKVHTMYSSAYPDCDTWVQTRGQSKSDQQQVLDSLESGGHRVGFAIAGGVFGEGIDYKGDRLIGVIIVGTGLPARSEEVEQIAQYYRANGRDGYEQAYVYPSFTRVLQTAGRLIRHEHDKGFVLLVDSRFGSTRYRQLYPSHWHLQKPANLPELVQNISMFWERFMPA